jgi:hypothetical protein
MKQAALVIALCAAACGPREPGEDPGPGGLRLCVENAAPAHGNITARAGLVRFDVLPGQRVCKPVSFSGVDIPLTAITSGGGLTGPLRYAERLRPGGSRCWTWRLTGSPASAANPVPCDDEPDADTLPGGG